MCSDQSNIVRPWTRVVFRNILFDCKLQRVVLGELGSSGSVTRVLTPRCVLDHAKVRQAADRSLVVFCKILGRVCEVMPRHFWCLCQPHLAERSFDHPDGLSAFVAMTLVLI